MKRFFWFVAILLIIFVAYEYQPARYHALLCTDERAVPGGRWNSAYDGYILGADGCFYDLSKTPLESIRPLQLSNTVNSAEPLWYINGANLRADWVYAQMHRLARTSNRPVLTIYNATEGGRLLDAFVDAMHGSLARQTAQRVIAENLAGDSSLYFQVNSQGAFHMAEALKKITERYSNEILAKIHIVTAGGAASRFPNGPRYFHLANDKDPVPRNAGVLSEGAQLGLGAELIVFSTQYTDSMEKKFRLLDPISRSFMTVHGLLAYQPYFPSVLKPTSGK